MVDASARILRRPRQRQPAEPIDHRQGRGLAEAAAGSVGRMGLVTAERTALRDATCRFRDAFFLSLCLSIPNLKRRRTDFKSAV
jgi:hypothetical protein